MSEKPEALRLADDLDAYHTRSCHKEAAAELRRLHAENERLHAQRDALLAEHQQTLALQQRSYEREIQLEVEAEREACAKLAESTVCDTHLPTGVRIYGTRAAAAIRARTP